jgi:hypothetical protein
MAAWITAFATRPLTAIGYFSHPDIDFLLKLAQ